jgi:hypothetical protein
MIQRSPFRYFKRSPEIIRLTVMLYVRYPLSLRNVEDLLHERGIELSHETVRFWWNRFGPMFAAEIRRKRVDRMRSLPHWRWHLDEVFVKVNGVTHYLSSGPAVTRTAPTGRTHDRIPQDQQKLKSILAQTEPSTHDSTRQTVPWVLMADTVARA